MKVSITRIDPTLPLPEYKTKGAVAFDLYSRVTMSIKPGEILLVPANLIVQVPKGYGLFVFSRSSLHKRGLMLANSVGIIDRDYCGPEDELRMPLHNFTKKVTTIERGDRLAQAAFLKVPTVGFKEITVKKKASRGGFGSTGHK